MLRHGKRDKEVKKSRRRKKKRRKKSSGQDQSVHLMDYTHVRMYVFTALPDS